MTVKERLKEYRNLEKEIRKLEEEVEVIYTKATAPGKYRLSHEQHSPNLEPDRMAELVSDMTDKALMLGNCIRQAKNERQAIEDMISSLKPAERQLIRMRYVEGLRWENIAVELTYSIQHVWRLHGNILSRLEAKDESL